jgi:hypothetical protein
MVPPQPSEAVPQVCPAGHDVAGVQPQTPGIPPPPQVSGAVQVPQLMVPPQPFEAVPQVCPAGHDVAGVQHPSGEHTCPVWQADPQVPFMHV